MSKRTLDADEALPLIRERLDAMVGLPVSQVYAHEYGGSDISLAIGELNLLRFEFKGEERRREASAHGIFITVSWRLQHRSTVLCAARDPWVRGGVLYQTVENALEQKTLTGYELRNDALDVDLRFSDDIALITVNDSSPHSEDADGYLLTRNPELLPPAHGDSIHVSGKNGYVLDRSDKPIHPLLGREPITPEVIASQRARLKALE